MNLPPEFIRSVAGLPGMDESAFINAHQQSPPVSIRINPSKWRPDLIETLPVDGKVPWCEHGYYLKERPSFTLDPLFHAGAYYVQEPSSMFLAHALQTLCDLSKPLRVLDLCAAPGGKSTLIQSMINEESLLVSNEVIRGRVGVLCDNLTRWGAANVVVTGNDAGDFARLSDFFDVMVVDAPCSGSGLFRKEPESIKEWSEKNVALCAARQKRILADALPSLQGGGILIYSTCSYSEQENEMIGRWLVHDMEMESLRIECPENWHIEETLSDGTSGYRFYPHALSGEGFFLSAFRKKGETAANDFRIKKPAKADLKTCQAASVFCLTDEMYPAYDGNGYMICSASAAQHLGRLTEILNIRKAGVRCGSLIHGEWIPDHELALSKHLAAEVPRISPEKNMVLDYLRRATFHVDTDRRGWTLVAYLGLAIGWIKILDSRVNNYYPKSWRILNK